MYQFPLGVFAIALATAIFPKLSSDAHELDQRPSSRIVLRRGLEACLFVGLPVERRADRRPLPGDPVALPARQLHRRRRRPRRPLDRVLLRAPSGRSRMQQILNRAYYALHDTITPLVMSIVNLIVNLVVEIPLLWTPPGRSRHGRRHAVSFAIQAVVMLYMLDRRVGGLGLSRERQARRQDADREPADVGRVRRHPVHAPLPQGRRSPPQDHLGAQLAILMTVGGVVYLGACMAMGIDVLQHVKPQEESETRNSNDESMTKPE